MTLAVRRARFAAAVWLGCWAAKADGSLLSGALIAVLAFGMFDGAYAHALTVRDRWRTRQVSLAPPSRPYLRFLELLAVSAAAGYLLARLLIAAVLR